jgi:hypothetical protein
MSNARYRGTFGGIGPASINAITAITAVMSQLL